MFSKRVWVEISNRLGGVRLTKSDAFKKKTRQTEIFRLFIPAGVGQGGPEYFGQAPWAAYYPVEEPQAPYMSFDSRMKVLVDQVEYYFSDANLAKG